MASKPSLRARLFSTSTRKSAGDEGEQGSATSLSGTSTDRRVPFYRRKPLSSSTLIKPTPGLARYRPSFLSRVVTRVVPCVTHPDTPVQPLPLQQLPAPAPAAPPAPPPISTDDLDSSLPIAAGFSIPPSPAITSSPADTDIVVPPPISTTLLPEDETDGVTSGAVQPPGSSGTIHSEFLVAHSHSRSHSPSPPKQKDNGDSTPGVGVTAPPGAPDIAQSHSTATTDSAADSDGTSSVFTEDDAEREALFQLEMENEEARLIRMGGSGIPIGPDGIPRPLLPPIAPEHAGRKCLVLDLDETLVHSSFKAVAQADFIVPVEIEYHWHHFHVLKRPGVDSFLKEMGEIYEVVIFTASLSKYADPVLDKLDTHRVVAHRLFRESCFNHKGNYVKDLSQLGRPIGDTIILDNSPASYIFHPHNAVPVSSWFNDPHDAELTDLVPFLADLAKVGDVRGVLDGAR
ncbi:hypothetical protein D9619_001838 [Psilocybe cf. subviscida]|uniref:protein-serine/threonine phosphatase n=1 Tax=Psilocybe cf. subviscida TaxID=2480587 RepID=A0A8H5BFI9_9AGAR|nr:hypothetical protein D9619_001838 [Psilocybe cf. subviscida]